MKNNFLTKFGITEIDLNFLKENGFLVEDIENQLLQLSTSKKKVNAIAPATIDNHFIKTFTSNKIKEFLNSYEKHFSNKIFINTIPAAGAATRQFQLLKTICYNVAFANINNLQAILKKNNELLNTCIKEEIHLYKEVKENCLDFWNGILNKKFAFYNELEEKLKENNLDLKKLIKEEDIKTIMLYIIDESGLNYGELPKALIKFHSYNDLDSRLAIEEHIRLTIKLNKKSKKIAVHFILSKEHLKSFNNSIRNIFSSENFLAFCKSQEVRIENLEVQTSFQENNTDTIALNLKDQQIARNVDNTILLRKGGHGALLKNINNIDADGIWLQNIDNILYENKKICGLSVFYKKLMAGMALQLNEIREEILNLLDESKNKEIELDNILTRVSNEFFLEIEVLDNNKNVISDLKSILNRPIVIAGYVALKEGQKGGGPFVVEEKFKSIILRKTNTVEGAEFNDSQLHSIYEEAKFFNPVNFFILKKNSNNQSFNLFNACDESRSFVTLKSDAKGNPIKAMEKPGLWNGSLMHTLQISIPIPENLFSAVKTIAGNESLLSKLHQKNDFDSFTENDFKNKVIDKETAEYISKIIEES